MIWDLAGRMIKAFLFERLSSAWNKGGARVPELTDLSPGPSFRTDDFLLKASLAYLDPRMGNFLRSSTSIVLPSPAYCKLEKRYGTDRLFLVSDFAMCISIIRFRSNLSLNALSLSPSPIVFTFWGSTKSTWLTPINQSWTHSDGSEHTCLAIHI